jgi:hypothetical protein
MTAEEIIETVVRAGGTLKIQGDNVKYWFPQSLAPLIGELRERKPQVIALLRREGGRIAVFPHCPRCAGYYLYRKDNIGLYECVTCGLAGIEESIARRLI